MFEVWTQQEPFDDLAFTSTGTGPVVVDPPPVVVPPDGPTVTGATSVPEPASLMLLTSAIGNAAARRTARVAVRRVAR